MRTWKVPTAKAIAEASLPAKYTLHVLNGRKLEPVSEHGYTLQLACIVFSERAARLQSQGKMIALKKVEY